MASRMPQKVGITTIEVLHELLQRGPGKYTSDFHKGLHPGCSLTDMLQECGDLCLR